MLITQPSRLASPFAELAQSERGVDNQSERIRQRLAARLKRECGRDINEHKRFFEQLERSQQWLHRETSQCDPQNQPQGARAPEPPQRPRAQDPNRTTTAQNPLPSRHSTKRGEKVLQSYW